MLLITAGFNEQSSFFVQISGHLCFDLRGPAPTGSGVGGGGRTMSKRIKRAFKPNGVTARGLK